MDAKRTDEGHLAQLSRSVLRQNLVPLISAVAMHSVGAGALALSCFGKAKAVLSKEDFTESNCPPDSSTPEGEASLRSEKAHTLCIAQPFYLAPPPGELAAKLTERAASGGNAVYYAA